MNALILSNLAAKDYISKLRIVQNRVAHLVLDCNYTNIVKHMHNNLNWLLVKNRLLYSLFVFFRNIFVSKTLVILYIQTFFSADKQVHMTRHVSAGKLTLPKAKTNAEN